MNQILRKVIVRLTPMLWGIDINYLKKNNITHLADLKEGFESVALVRLDAIGDFILWLDAARGFRAAWKDKRLVLVCNKACESIARSTNIFDEIVPIDTGKLNFAGNFKFRKELHNQLRSVKVDMVLQTAFTRRVYTDVVVSAIDAARKITIKDTSFDNAAKWALEKTNAIYDEIIDTKNQPLMELIRNAELVRKVADKDFHASAPRLEPMEVREGLIPKEDYFVIFPGGSFKAKMWPMDRFAKVASFINENTNWTCVVCGAPNEKYLAEEFKKSYSKAFMDYTGKTSLIESIEVIRNAKLLVGNDTSGIHFAAATDTKAICVFGGWHYGRFLPYQIENDENRPLPKVCINERDCFNCKIINKSAECKEHMKKTGLFTCVDDVSVENVINKVKDYLQ